MSRAAQLNVRMSPQLKAAGDSVLDLYGISSTELIRALWEKISLGEASLRQILQALAADPAAGSARLRNAAGNHNGMASMVLQRQKAFEREMGLDASTYVPIDDEELQDLVYTDWLEEEYMHAL